MNQLQFSQISKRFGKRVILEQVGLSLTQGQCALLTGANGAGKTTLLRILAGLEKPDSFNANTLAQTLNWTQYRHTFKSQVFYLHQQPYLFAGSVWHNLDYALPRTEASKQRRYKVQTALEWAELTTIAHNDAKRVSGGEAQRIAITRAWLRAPHYLLLDEPTVNMDQDARQRTYALLQKLQAAGVALLICTHDPKQFPDYQQHWQLEQGQLHEVNL